MDEQYLLKNTKDKKLKSIDQYIEYGGYKALEKCIKEMKPGEIISTIEESGLRGRGGGWFQTGKKWRMVIDSANNNKDKPVYLCCNCAEGEPGSFKDRLIIEKNPHLVLEAVAIASYALDVHTAFIYVRGEFQEAVHILENAVEEAKEKGFLGENIMGSGYSLKEIIFRSGGNYICGEETALLNSIEGWPAVPRQKPPYPVEQGLFASPTLINNIETFSNIPFIINNGVQWFQSIGHESCKGNMLFSISGHVNKPGVYELPIGKYTLRQIINDIAGGVKDGKKIKGIIPGGGSSGFLLEEELDVLAHPEDLKKMGSSLGTGSIIVMDEDTDIVTIMRKLAEFFKEESCKNECDVCKMGTSQLYSNLLAIENNNGTMENIERLESLVEKMKEGGICVMPQVSSHTIETGIKRYKEELIKRIN